MSSAPNDYYACVECKEQANRALSDEEDDPDFSSSDSENEAMTDEDHPVVHSWTRRSRVGTIKFFEGSEGMSSFLRSGGLARTVCFLT